MIAQEITEPNCRKRTLDRGIGTIPTVCDGDLDAGLCYPKCGDGFYGVGPVCWQSCPEGFRDDGAFCAKPALSYGRGAGYVVWAEQQCKDESGGPCEKNGALWYPICKQGYRGNGPVCWSTISCPAEFPYDNGNKNCFKNPRPRPAQSLPSDLAGDSAAEIDDLIHFPYCALTLAGNISPTGDIESTLPTRSSAPVSRPPSSSAIVVKASEFLRPLNVKVGDLLFGEDVLLNGLDNAPPGTLVPNAAEFEFSAPSGGTYLLKIEYAAAVARPSKIILNGVTAIENAMNAPTGCWEETCQSLIDQGTVSLKEGLNIMRVERNDVFPHIRSFAFELVE